VIVALPKPRMDGAFCMTKRALSAQTKPDVCLPGPFTMTPTDPFQNLIPDGRAFLSDLADNNSKDRFSQS